MHLHDYWKNRGKKFHEELTNQPGYVLSYMENQENQIIKLLRKQKWKKILEVGCGSGRITRKLSNLPDLEKITAMDISPDLIETAKKTVSNSIVEFQCKNLEDFDILEKFDLVFSCEVLQHIDFENIQEILTKLITFSNHKVVLVESFDPEKIGTSVGGYLFFHDYLKILNKMSQLKKIKFHKLQVPLSLKLIDYYAKMRNRSPFGKQSIIEIEIQT